jgi:hypothetical protein
LLENFVAFLEICQLLLGISIARLENCAGLLEILPALHKNRADDLEEGPPRLSRLAVTATSPAPPDLNYSMAVEILFLIETKRLW